MTSVQLGVDGQVLLRPLAPQRARAMLNQLTQAYLEAWNQALPVACKTAWAYLQVLQHNPARVAAGKPAKDPHEAARGVFEGGQFGGELAESAYLQRAFESYADLQQGLPHWAQQIYADLLAHAELLHEGPP